MPTAHRYDVFNAVHLKDVPADDFGKFSLYGERRVTGKLAFVMYDSLYSKFSPCDWYIIPLPLVPVGALEGNFRPI